MISIIMVNEVVMNFLTIYTIFFLDDLASL